MRDIVLSIRNNLVCEALTRSLAESGEFCPYKLLFSRENEVLRECTPLTKILPKAVKKLQNRRLKNTTMKR